MKSNPILNDNSRPALSLRAKMGMKVQGEGEATFNWNWEKKCNDIFDVQSNYITASHIIAL